MGQLKTSRGITPKINITTHSEKNQEEKTYPLLKSKKDPFGHENITK